MWPALIRGSVFSSIRNSALIPSDHSSDNILPSLHDNNTHHTPSTDTKHISTNNNNSNSDYNLNSWMKKDTTTSDATPHLPPLTSAYRCEMLSIKELTTTNTSRYSAEPIQPFSGHYFDKVTHANRSPTREPEDDTEDDYEDDYYSEGDQILDQLESTNNKRSRSTTKGRKKQKWKYESSSTTLLSSSGQDKDSDRPHACTLCDRRFKRRFNLNAHIRTHDPNRKKLFDCPSCNQSFDRKHDRDRHMDALHYAHKHRYFCHLCDASFSRRDALARHSHKRHPSMYI